MFPIDYHQPLYRPPSEAEALILQVTLGCSWNRCTFCDMYARKRFRPRPPDELLAEIVAIASSGLRYRRVFLADGDALVLSSRRLMAILEAIRRHLPWTIRVSCYASPSNLLGKPVAELETLREAGLALVYLGIESGDDTLLGLIDKGATQAETIAALRRAGAAGLQRSVMIVNGLGGRHYSARHAAASAAVLNATAPEFASVLALRLPPDPRRFTARFGADWQPLDDRELLLELRELVALTELDGTLFRSNHASNLLALAGVLSRDRRRLVAEIDRVAALPYLDGSRRQAGRRL